MKNKLLTIFLMFLSSLLFSQSIEIEKGKKTFCVGDTIKLDANIIGIDSKPVNFSWTLTPEYEFTVGKKPGNISIIANNKDTIVIILTVTYDYKDERKELSDTSEVVINEIPDSKPEVSFFQKENDLFAEIKGENNYVYELTSPSKIPLKGEIVKFKDKSTDFGEFKLLVTDTYTGCKSTFEYEYEPQKKEEIASNVFGTNEEDGISDRLYKEVQRDIPIYESTITGELLTYSYKIAHQGQRFTIIGEIDNDYIVRFWEIFSKGNNNNKNNDSKPLVSDDKMYKLLLTKCDAKLIYNSNNKPVGSAEIKSNGEKDKSTKKTDNNGYFNLDLDDEITEITIRGDDGLTSTISIPSSYDVSDPSQVEEHNEIYTIKNKSKRGLKEFRYFRVRKDAVDSRSLSISPGIFTKHSQPFKNGSISFTAGTTLIPVKIRKSALFSNNDEKFEFSKDVALGPFVGMRGRISEYKSNFLNIGFSVGVSSVRLTSDNSNPELTTSVQDLAALTLSFGAVFEFDKIQMGLFLGKDKVNNNILPDGKGYQWDYQNKCWWSVGFGYTIVDRPSNSKNRERADAITD